MNIFLDSSVLLAACGTSTGASRFIVENARRNSWMLLTSHYVIHEVQMNLPKLPLDGRQWFTSITNNLIRVTDVLSFSWPVVSVPAKDRPVLFTAAAWADVLLTLDRHDFAELIGSDFYWLPIFTPGGFLMQLREKGQVVHGL